MLEHLFSPFELKGKTVRNRCVVPAMVADYCNEDGTVTEKFIAYHEAKAKGGFGLIITEDFAITPRGKGFPNIPGLWNDGQIAGFSEFTRRIHAQGALVVAQIYHCGRQTNSPICGGQPWAPSAIPCPFSADMPHEMTLEEIKTTISQYGDCARRAKEAGFDGVEIHGAHGYLIAQFMSPYSNKRTDCYGGSLRNRVRFALEVIRDVREKCGDDFIVGYRISANEYVTGGRSVVDTCTIVPMLEAEGIDYINVSAGVYRSFDAVIPSMYSQHGWICDDAAEVKKITNLPVITVGRDNDPFIADTVLALGKADFVAMGRQSLCDPDTPRKAQEGRFSEIRTCIACHHGCVNYLLRNEPIRCILNPTLGRESEYQDIKAETPKKVMVIGAGPAGLETAISAAKCGHKVKVYEKNRWAGGQFRLGAVPPGKGEMVNYINWQLHQLEMLGVPVMMETEVTAELAEQEKPDVVIAATGAVPVIPKIPGVEKAHVVTAHQVLSGEVNTGGRVVVIGGGCVGAETANHLASNLKAVTLVEMQDDIALDEMLVPRWGLLDDVKKNGVRICTGTTVEEILDDSVRLTGKVQETVPADTVVLAVGSKPVTALAEELKAAGYPVHILGDALKPGLAGEAIFQGFELGRSL